MLTSGLDIKQLEAISAKMIGERDIGPKLVAEKLEEVVGPNKHEINAVVRDLIDLCKVCTECGYVSDTDHIEVGLCLACTNEMDYGLDDDDFDDDGDYYDDDYDDEDDDDDWDDDE